jgi:transposase
MKIAFYDTSLTDAQWELIQPMLPARLRVFDRILCIAIGLMSEALGWNFWLRMRPVDGGCAGGESAIWVRGIRPKLMVKMVERAFGWLMRHRRMARGYERTASGAAAWVNVAMPRLHAGRLA